MKIPKETQEKIIRYQALKASAEQAVQFFWGEKRTVKYNTEAVVLMDEIKEYVFTTKPEWKSFNWRYIDGDYEVFEGK